MINKNITRRKLISSVPALVFGVSFAPFLLSRGSSIPVSNTENNNANLLFQNDSCERLIQFDTVTSSEEYASIYTTLEMIDESNYENAKKNLGVKLPEFLSGNYSEFSEKRSQLRKMMDHSNTTFSKSNYYHHVLSAAGAQLYADCIAKNSGRPISAWIEAKMDTIIIIGIKNGMPGNSNIEFELSGAIPSTPLKDNSLSSGSIKHLIFTYDKKTDFALIVSGNIKAIGSIQSTVIVVPKVVKIVKKNERRKLTGKIKCGAGCQSKNSGCQEVRDFVFTADPDFYLLDSTLQKGAETIVGGPGVRNYSIEIKKEGTGSSLMMASSPLRNWSLSSTMEMVIILLIEVGFEILKLCLAGFL